MAELYAIVGSMERARLMLEAGAPYLQLRFKGTPLAPHREEVQGWRKDYPGTRVIVNDDLELACAWGVWGAHLGQEDLDSHDPGAIRAASVQVGISTHSDEEIERALACDPALLGFGPVFPTATKEIEHAPQGVARLREIVERSTLPIVAIGGIGEEQLQPVVETGVAMVAMISFLDRFHEPAQVRDLMARMAGP